MNIGDAAKAAGVTPKMVRHYELLGLIPEAERTGSGYRLYGSREIGMLKFIRQSRGFGFSTRQIDSLLALWRDDGRESRQVKRVAEAQLAELEQRQRELDEMRATLSRLVADCADDAESHCAIIESLAADAPAPGRVKARTLKEVRAGEKRPAGARRTAAKPVAAPAAGHLGLMAWAHSAAQRS
ncbi:MAG: MerR family DNA-binding transcriptional regulator [Burkholderiales bacterium]|nr:MerR family DNA-binding transcriptional regulator [Burkholderiales bacterium]